MIESYTNDIGKLCWNGVEQSTAFDVTMFTEVECPLYEDRQWAMHTNIGSLTVLDRMTGFGNGMRDIETGFRDKGGNFWLASGNLDVRCAGVSTVGEAIEWVKRMANTCVPEEMNRCKS